MALERIVGIFEAKWDSDQAVRRLKESGFLDKEITVILKETEPIVHTTDLSGSGAAAGTLFGGGAGLLFTVAVMAATGAGAGWGASLLAGIAAGAGLGLLIGAMIGRTVAVESASSAKRSSEGSIVVAVNSPAHRVEMVRELFQIHRALRVYRHDSSTSVDGSLEKPAG